MSLPSYCGLAIRGGQAAPSRTTQPEAAMRVQYPFTTFLFAAALLAACDMSTSPEPPDEPEPAVLTVAPSFATIGGERFTRLVALLSGSAAGVPEEMVTWISSDTQRRDRRPGWTGGSPQGRPGPDHRQVGVGPRFGHRGGAGPGGQEADLASSASLTRARPNRETAPFGGRAALRSYDRRAAPRAEPLLLRLRSTSSEISRPTERRHSNMSAR